MARTRRDFLLAGGVVAGAGLLARGIRAEAAPVLRLGILGDLIATSPASAP